MNGTVPSISETCRFLSDPGLDGRYPGSEGHEEAKEYPLQMLKDLDFQPLFDGKYTQDVLDGTKPIGTNLGGMRPGRTGRTILLGAHYDHFKGIPGADDNAAALSILIETSRLLSTWSRSHNLVLCFFDLEEPPYFHTSRMGSVYFAAHAPLDLKTLECAIVLDLCGHDIAVPGIEDAVFLLGAESSVDLLETVRSISHQPLPVHMIDNDRIGDMSDHHAFRVHNVPFLFFSCGQWEHYHAPSDTFDKLNLDKMQRLAEYIADLIRALDDRSVAWNPVPNFWQVERETLQRISGTPVPNSEHAVEEIIKQLLRRF